MSQGPRTDNNNLTMEQEKVSEKSINGEKMGSHAQKEEPAGADVIENLQAQRVSNRATFDNSNQNSAPQGRSYSPPDVDVESLSPRANWSILSGDSADLLSETLPQFWIPPACNKDGTISEPNKPLSEIWNPKYAQSLKLTSRSHAFTS